MSNEWAAGKISPLPTGEPWPLFWVSDVAMD